MKQLSFFSQMNSTFIRIINITQELEKLIT